MNEFKDPYFRVFTNPNEKAVTLTTQVMENGVLVEKDDIIAPGESIITPPHDFSGFSTEITWKVMESILITSTIKESLVAFAESYAGDTLYSDFIAHAQIKDEEKALWLHPDINESQLNAACKLVRM